MVADARLKQALGYTLAITILGLLSWWADPDWTSLRDVSQMELPALLLLVPLSLVGVIQISLSIQVVANHFGRRLKARDWPLAASREDKQPAIH